MWCDKAKVVHHISPHVSPHSTAYFHALFIRHSATTSRTESRHRMRTSRTHEGCADKQPHLVRLHACLNRYPSKQVHDRGIHPRRAQSVLRQARVWPHDRHWQVTAYPHICTVFRPVLGHSSAQFSLSSLHIQSGIALPFTLCGYISHAFHRRG